MAFQAGKNQFIYFIFILYHKLLQKSIFSCFNKKALPVISPHEKDFPVISCFIRRNVLR